MTTKTAAQKILPLWVRVVLYIGAGVGTPIVLYLQDKHIVDADFVRLWSAEVTVAGSVAAFKALVPDRPTEPDDEVE